jgi:hypothetical protein
MEKFNQTTTTLILNVKDRNIASKKKSTNILPCYKSHMICPRILRKKGRTNKEKKNLQILNQELRS